LRVSAALAAINFPTPVEPVNEIMSIRGSVTTCCATEFSAAVTTLTTPGGISVSSAINRPMRVAVHGVFGSGFSTTVLPVARAWPSLFSAISKGKFQGTMAATTPTAFFQTTR